MLNKKDIDEKKFESSFRGYSKEEVDDFCLLYTSDAADD